MLIRLDYLRSGEGERTRMGHLMTSMSPHYDDLNALFINCTLKPSPELSHTQGLIEASAGIMAEQGARTGIIRAVDHDIATGVWPDMTEHGAPNDAWLQLYPKVLAADILVIAGPIWLG
jgi:multimeric flavodoxin WrbA